MQENLATYGYARVSTKDQNLDRQIDALVDFGVSEKMIFKDKASGKDFNRPAYKRLIRKLKPGDVLVIKSIDRLGRNYDEILNEWRLITKEKCAAVVILDMPLLDTREAKDGITGVFLADFVLQLLSYVAQVERENIKRRQAEGIAAARARGVKFGRPRLSIPEQFPTVLEAFNNGEINREEAACMLGCCVTTFDQWRKESLK